MKDLIAYNTSVLHKVDALLHQLTDEQLARPLDLLFGSSIGQHFRHVLEFYACLLTHVESGLFSYDDRQRDPVIGTEVIAARASAVRSMGLLSDLRMDKPLRMVSELPGKGRSCQDTTLKRELAYLADHGVHHLAMVRVALEQHFPGVVVPEDLGVAASTRNHRTMVNANA